MTKYVLNTQKKISWQNFQQLPNQIFLQIWIFVFKKLKIILRGGFTGVALKNFISSFNKWPNSILSSKCLPLPKKKWNRNLLVICTSTHPILLPTKFYEILCSSLRVTLTKTQYIIPPSDQKHYTLFNLLRGHNNVII